jgi:hypothetical protein
MRTFKTSTGSTIAAVHETSPASTYQITIDGRAVWRSSRRRRPLLDDRFLDASYREIRLGNRPYGLMTIEDDTSGNGNARTKTVFVIDILARAYRFFYREAESASIGGTDYLLASARLDVVGTDRVRISYLDMPIRECIVGEKGGFGLAFGARQYRLNPDGSFRQIRRRHFDIVTEGSMKLPFRGQLGWESAARRAMTTVAPWERAGIRETLADYRAGIDAAPSYCGRPVPAAARPHLRRAVDFLLSQLK